MSNKQESPSPKSDFIKIRLCGKGDIVKKKDSTSQKEMRAMTYIQVLCSVLGNESFCFLFGRLFSCTTNFM